MRCTVTLVKLDFFAAPGPFMQLTVEQANMIRDLELGPADLCLVAQRLLMAPGEASGVGLSEQRLAERNTRPATVLFARALELDGVTPLGETRPCEVMEVRTPALPFNFTKVEDRAAIRMARRRALHEDHAQLLIRDVHAD